MHGWPKVAVRTLTPGIYGACQQPQHELPDESEWENILWKPLSTSSRAIEHFFHWFDQNALRR